jgi:cytochrome c oxidase subunit 3
MGGDGDGGGGGRDGGEEGRDPARLGLALALLGMCSLFAAFLVAYLLLRKNAATWPPPGAPLPPKGLWISTLVLLASSATIVFAERAKDPQAMRRGLALTLALGILFLVVQGILWREVFASGRFTFSDAYGTIFYSLTGLHGAHVIGGLVFLTRTSMRARRDPSGPRTRLALALCSTYWHFMDGIWLVLFGVLEFLN